MNWAAFESSFGTLTLIGVAALCLSMLIFFRKGSSLVAGLRFPARHRLDSVAPGWRVRLRGLPILIRFVVLVLVLCALSPTAKDRSGNGRG